MSVVSFRNPPWPPGSRNPWDRTLCAGPPEARQRVKGGKSRRPCNFTTEKILLVDLLPGRRAAILKTTTSPRGRTVTQNVPEKWNPVWAARKPVLNSVKVPRTPPKWGLDGSMGFLFWDIAPNA